MENTIKHLYCKTPCRSCPFRKDVKRGWLGEKRARGIVEKDSFVCHYSVDYAHIDMEEENLKNRRQCSGHLQVVKEGNTFWKLARAFGIQLGLRGGSKLVENKEEFINNHKE